MGEVVWVSGQKVSRVQRKYETFRAFCFHYRRVLLGPQSGMPQPAL